LHIVDCNDYRLLRSKRSQRAQEGERDDALLHGVAAGVGDGECGRERTPLRRRQLRKQLRQGAADEVTERGEREAGFGLGRARREHAKASPACRLRCCEPHRCLPDPGLAHEHGGPREAVRVEEPSERLELVLPADWMGTGDGQGSHGKPTTARTLNRAGFLGRKRPTTRATIGTAGRVTAG
jgi:hypothetical protein